MMCTAPTINTLVKSFSHVLQRKTITRYATATLGLLLA